MFLGITVIPFQDLKHLTTNYVSLNTEVDYYSMNTLLDKIKEANDFIVPFESTVVTINSPGGLADALVEFQRADKGSVPIDTYISVSAASAAALAFLEGRNRYMHPEATILFHGVRVFVNTNYGVLIVTAPDARHLVEHKVFRDDTAEHNKKVLQHLKESGDLESILSELSKLLEDIVADMEDMDKKMVSYVAKKLDVSEEFVRSFLIVPNKDVVLTAEQAHRLGIATHVKSFSEAA